jgi:hypothetical protein
MDDLIGTFLAKNKAFLWSVWFLFVSLVQMKKNHSTQRKKGVIRSAVLVLNLRNQKGVTRQLHKRAWARPSARLPKAVGLKIRSDGKDATFGQFQLGNQRTVPGRLKVCLEAFLNGLPPPVERELMQYQGLETGDPIKATGASFSYSDVSYLDLMDIRRRIRIDLPAAGALYDFDMDLGPHLEIFFEVWK